MLHNYLKKLLQGFILCLVTDGSERMSNDEV